MKGDVSGRGATILNAAIQGSATSHSLAALGVSEREEQVYRALLGHHKVTAENVARLLSSTLEQARLWLDNLERKGLAAHTPGQPTRYIATPPEFAAELLINQRQVELELARVNMRNLTRLRSNDPGALEQPVEIISDPAMLDQFLRHLTRSAKAEILVFERAPVAYDSANDVKPGDVSVRAVTDATLLERYGPHLIRDVEAGEEVRFFRSLPAKLIIVDRALAIIHLKTNNAVEETHLVVRRPSMLLDALLVLFELVWESASPIAPDGKVKADHAAPEEPDEMTRLITLLSMGLHDKAIAHEAGISASTLTRRLAELMKSYGTRSRFQLGWRAALDAFPERVKEVSRASGPAPGPKQALAPASDDARDEFCS